MAIPWSRLTLKDLRAVAAQAAIPARAAMRRRELVRVLQSAARGDPLIREMVHAKIAAAARAGKVSGPTKQPPREACPPEAPSSPSPERSGQSDPGAPFVNRGKPIPNTYGDDRLRFMVRDPWSGYLYWELTGPATDRLRLAYGNEFLTEARWQMRVTSLLARTSSDEPVDVHACHAYVALRPGGLYLATLGFLDPEAVFVEVLRAGPVSTPRASISPVVDEEWAVEAEELAALAGGPGLSLRGIAVPSSIWQVRCGRCGARDGTEPRA